MDMSSDPLEGLKFPEFRLRDVSPYDQQERSMV